MHASLSNCREELGNVVGAYDPCHHERNQVSDECTMNAKLEDAYENKYQRQTNRWLTQVLSDNAALHALCDSGRGRRDCHSRRRGKSQREPSERPCQVRLVINRTGEPWSGKEQPCSKDRRNERRSAYAEKQNTLESRLILPPVPCPKTY